METTISTEIPEELKEPCSVRDAVGDALIAAEERGIKPSRLVLAVAKDAFDALTAWQGWVHEFNVIPWEDFVRGYKAGKTNVMLCDVKLIPAEWGTGWTLREKRKGKK
jgi:hypothetical protein